MLLDFVLLARVYQVSEYAVIACAAKTVVEGIQDVLSARLEDVKLRVIALTMLKPPQRLIYLLLSIYQIRSKACNSYIVELA